MTDTEKLLQDFLDQHPDEHTARLALADLLDEQGDPRAAGMRELARRKIVPEKVVFESGDVNYLLGRKKSIRSLDSVHFGGGRVVATKHIRCLLPDPWFKRLKDRFASDPIVSWRYYESIREACNVAALAFLSRASASRTVPAGK